MEVLILVLKAKLIKGYDRLDSAYFFSLVLFFHFFVCLCFFSFKRLISLSVDLVSL